MIDPVADEQIFAVQSSLVLQSVDMLDLGCKEFAHSQLLVDNCCEVFSHDGNLSGFEPQYSTFVQVDFGYGDQPDAHVKSCGVAELRAMLWLAS